MIVCWQFLCTVWIPNQNMTVCDPSGHCIFGQCYWWRCPPYYTGSIPVPGLECRYCAEGVLTVSTSKFSTLGFARLQYQDDRCFTSDVGSHAEKCSVFGLLSCKWFLICNYNPTCSCIHMQACMHACKVYDLPMHPDDMQHGLDVTFSNKMHVSGLKHK